jgi:hypothetical protein
VGNRKIVVHVRYAEYLTPIPGLIKNAELNILTKRKREFRSFGNIPIDKIEFHPKATRQKRIVKDERDRFQTSSPNLSHLWTRFPGGFDTS